METVNVADSGSPLQRVEVGLPELFDSITRWQRLRLWMRKWIWMRRWILMSPLPMSTNRLVAAKADFLRQLIGVGLEPHCGYDTAALVHTIERAGSLRELWHLRTLVHQHIAYAISQDVAHKRMARLNTHFPKVTS